MIALRRLLVTLVLAALAAAAPVAAAPPDPRDPALRPEERVEALLERIRQEQAGVRTLEAAFVQKKESSLLAGTSEARGTVSFAAPDRVRWEYDSPDPMVVVIADDVMTTWYEELGKAERLPVGRYSDQVFKYLGATRPLDDLEQYFSLRVAFPDDPTEPYRIELLPRYQRMKKRLAKMTLWVDGERYVPAGLRLEEADGDVTEYRFSAVRVNGEMPPGRFRLELPPGVEVRTLAAGAAGQDG